MKISRIVDETTTWEEEEILRADPTFPLHWVGSLIFWIFVAEGLGRKGGLR